MEKESLIENVTPKFRRVFGDSFHLAIENPAQALRDLPLANLTLLVTSVKSSEISLLAEIKGGARFYDIMILAIDYYNRIMTKSEAFKESSLKDLVIRYAKEQKIPLETDAGARDINDLKEIILKHRVTFMAETKDVKHFLSESLMTSFMKESMSQFMQLREQEIYQLGKVA